jgi:hypothetical protein
MRKVPIDKATEQELRAFATGTLGLEIHHSSKREKILGQVQAVWDKPEITVADEAPPALQAGTPPQPVTAAQQPPAKEMVRIIIAVTDDAGGNEPVPVSVNGSAMLIPRGKPVDIPLPYYKALENTVQHRFDPNPDGNGMSFTPRLVPAYPFQRVA